ncbi:hypothetical protein [Gordonia caeni]|uniref:Transposase n=1 Tax=Gordonia caeni TaxID=1007097 RepID=A0ABP7NJQ3_9ACTN
MPKPYPKEFRDDVVRVAKTREPGVHLKQIAADFGISESCLTNRMRTADVEDGNKPGLTDSDRAENRELKKPPVFWSRKRGPAPGGRVSVAGESVGKMMYPLVRGLAGDGVARNRPISI